jgi:hypothetical protein
MLLLPGPKITSDPDKVKRPKSSKVIDALEMSSLPEKAMRLWDGYILISLAIRII